MATTSAKDQIHIQLDRSGTVYPMTHKDTCDKRLAPGRKDHWVLNLNYPINAEIKECLFYEIIPEW